MQKIPLLFFVGLFLSFCFPLRAQSPERGFISTTQAKTWEEGLISGNGTIGANALGHPVRERIIFTHEESFFPKVSPYTPPDQSEHLFEIRRLIDRGCYKEAADLQWKYSRQAYFTRPDCFVPVCDLYIEMDRAGEIRDYIRSLDFETGESSVSWSDDGAAYRRTLFVSRADQVAVLRITTDAPQGISCRLGFQRRKPSPFLPYEYQQGSYLMASRYLKSVQIQARDNIMTYSHAFTRAYPGGIQSMQGAALLKIDGGSYEACDEKGVPHSRGNAMISVRNAREVLVLLSITPDYAMDSSRLEEMEQALGRIDATYDELLARHARIHGELFNRMRLDLGGADGRRLTTEELFARSTMDRIDPALLEKEFDAGRYNIISSTGKLPPVLQGLWAGTYVPDWQSDYTHNGNVPSAIASMLMGGTPELMLSYISYIEWLQPWLEINARHIFGCRGVILPSRSTTNGYNNVMASHFPGGFWVAGAPWAAHFFYDYYLYTGDRTYLKERGLPFMEKVGEFFEDFLYPGPDGKYIFSPSQSPENYPRGVNTQGSFNATMDVAVVKELYRNLISASQILKVNADKIPLWKEMLSRMPDYGIDGNGMFKEWLTPKLQNNDDHRHSSHLYPLFDTWPEEFRNDSALVEAVRKSVNYKLKKHWRDNQEGFMSFGLVQLGQVGATIGDRDIVYECLRHLANRFWLENMASTHNHKSLFNMDISGGMPAVIIKMLVYSDPGVIRLLPALPDVWNSKGAIEGVLCRGQIRIDRLEWTDTVIRLTLTSAADQKITLQYGENHKIVKLKSGRTITYELDRQKKLLKNK